MASKVMRWIGFGLAIGLLVAGAVLFLRDARQQRTPYATTIFAMDTVVELKLYGPEAQNAAHSIQRELQTLENELSAFVPTSDITKLNAAAGSGEMLPMSKTAYRLLEESKNLYTGSNGMFDVTVAPLLFLWNFGGENLRVPTSGEVARAQRLVGDSDLILDRQNKSAMLRRSGQAVELGGITKGYALDQIQHILNVNRIVNGYISLGGNLMVRGKNPQTKEDFVFGLRDPRGGPTEYIATLNLPGKTMATSGDYERFFIAEGKRYHHIIDPKTGYPVEGNDLISVSIIAESGLLGDFLSTSLFIGGKERLLSTFINDNRFSVIAIDPDFNVYLSSNLKGKVTQTPGNEQYKFQYVEK